MEQVKMNFHGRELPLYVTRALVIGSGCAGLNACDRLHKLGIKDVILMTEDMNSGTSRNAGSDKQTYYKLSLASDEPDSVYEMADTLFAPGVDGDVALAEAAGSVRGFLNLAEAGVSFPTNEYGEYVGYKTDHDPRRRATSAGPLTSKLMTEALEARVKVDGVHILDRSLAFRILVRNGRCAGVLALDLVKNEYFAVAAGAVLLATGGPACIYQDSVFPESQHGSLGMALEAGALGSNLNSWQYGLASTKFRWNVSGSYQQALPAFTADGEEFLAAGFGNERDAINAQFLKGYQWPFDVRKADASSKVDLLVHEAIHGCGKRVFMDFTREPEALKGGFGRLTEEAHTYLANCGALIPRPIDRLFAINAPAIDLYRMHGIDLWTEPLEIAVCAQHHNGGVSVDANWESSLPGLYVAGEAAGTFGAYRPGGSALNSTQVGSLRASEKIARENVSPAVDAEWYAALLSAPLTGFDPDGAEKAAQLRRDMSAWASHARSVAEMRKLRHSLANPTANLLPEKPFPGLSEALRARDQVIASRAVLSAMLLQAEVFGSMGSGLVLDGKKPLDPENTGVIMTDGRTATSTLRPRRPLPMGDQWFERVWKKNLEMHRPQ